jgi:ABC-type siderophore export system fused ATPase/permease subunit
MYSNLSLRWFISVLVVAMISKVLSEVGAGTFCEQLVEQIRRLNLRVARDSHPMILSRNRELC